MTVSPHPSLTKPSVTETRRVRLTSRILHIGSAVSRLNPFEYVKTEKFVYLPDQEALARKLRQRGFLQDYIARVENRQAIVSLLEDALGENWAQAKGEDDQPLFPKALRSVNWAGSSMTDLRPMIRNGFGHHYIPGSSIKGAIRTAIAYHLLKHGDRYQIPQGNRVSEIEAQFRKSMGELKSKAKFIDDRLFMNEIFSNFGLTYQERQVQIKQGPNTDILRAVHVSDSEPLLEQKIERAGRSPNFRNLPIVAEVLISSRFPNHRAKFKASIYAEMVFNVHSEFTLSIDHEMLTWFRHQQGMTLPFQSIDDLLNICQEFAQEQWDFEHDYWNEIKNNRDQEKNLDFDPIRELYEPEACPYTLRLGWGSGLRGTTIDLLLPDELVGEIRDTCGLKAPGFEAPKSRRTVVNSKGEIRYVPGWVKLEVL